MVKYVKFMRGTTAAYNKLAEKDDDTLYFLSDSVHEEGALYLGNKLISGPCEGGSQINTLGDIADVVLTEGLNYDAILMYDSKTGKWRDYSFDALTFAGATETLDGTAGFVPAPTVNDRNLFLRGDGVWATVAAQCQIFDGIKPANNQTHIDALNQQTEDVILNSGDIAIIQDLIADDKYQYTSYVYDGAKWCAMDGNYNAENVYFKSDLVFTEAIGAVEVPESGHTTVPAAGKNVKQLFETIFAKERNPEIEQPAILLITNHKAYEVGTKIQPSYSMQFTSGKYEFGPETSIKPLAYSLIATDNMEVVETVDSTVYPEEQEIIGEMKEIIEITDNTNYYITATVFHTNGDIPVTNLNNYYDEGRIEEGDISISSNALTGYRAFFYGMDNTDSELTSDFIRSNLTNGGPYDGQKKLTFTAADMEDVKRFIIAVPADTFRSGLVHATIISSMNVNVTSEYKQLDNMIIVNGENDYQGVNYKVWIYQPASIAATEIHEVTLS